METPTDDPTNRTAPTEPRPKGGVAGTDSKDFDSHDPFHDEQKPETELTSHPSNG